MKILLIIIFFLLLFSFLPSKILAAVDCSDAANKNKIECTFGTISPPPAIKSFLGPNDVTGATGISKFLSNLVTLIYTVATIVLIFMFLWGAFDWLTSGGEKEKLASAQTKIISAVIGIMLFAVAFAIIQVLGQFTGFNFFTTPSEQVRNVGRDVFEKTKTVFP